MAHLAVFLFRFSLVYKLASCCTVGVYGSSRISHKR